MIAGLTNLQHLQYQKKFCLAFRIALTTIAVGDDDLLLETSEGAGVVKTILFLLTGISQVDFVSDR
jgi:hypothetical protein